MRPEGHGTDAILAVGPAWVGDMVMAQSLFLRLKTLRPQCQIDVLAPAGDASEDFTDPRIRAGVLLSLAGLANNDLTPIATQLFPFMNPGFEHFSAPALITAGDADQSPLSTRGPDWWEDAYVYSPGSKDLLTLFGADHAQGGIHGYGTVPQSDSDNPATVALVQRVTTAYLRTVLGVDETSWRAAQQELASQPAPGGRITTK